MKQQIKRVNQKQKGFTLIELLITISIILILVSIGLPKLINYRENAEKIAIIKELENCLIHKSKTCKILQNTTTPQEIKFLPSTDIHNNSSCLKIYNKTLKKNHYIKYDDDTFYVNIICTNEQMWFKADLVK